MYNPLQIPYILNETYAGHMLYKETPADECGGFIICFWEMRARSDRSLTVNNIVVSDACIDIIVNYDKQLIGFSGMSKTEFDYTVRLPARYLGARLMPGAFHQLTGLPASSAMDRFLPFEHVYASFDQQTFFSLPFDQAKTYLARYLAGVTSNIRPDTMTTLFHELTENPVSSAAELYRQLNFSPRQCQRLFEKHYGITPKLALSILRFQKCLKQLTSAEAASGKILPIDGYYDQAHFIKDFKRNLGITPRELIRHYQT